MTPCPTCGVYLTEQIIHYDITVASLRFKDESIINKYCSFCDYNELDPREQNRLFDLKAARYFIYTMGFFFPNPEILLWCRKALGLTRAQMADYLESTIEDIFVWESSDNVLPEISEKQIQDLIVFIELELS